MVQVTTAASSRPSTAEFSIAHGTTSKTNKYSSPEVQTETKAVAAAPLAFRAIWGIFVLLLQGVVREG